MIGKDGAEARRPAEIPEPLANPETPTPKQQDNPIRFFRRDASKARKQWRDHDREDFER
jgi:hypothetical protein